MKDPELMFIFLPQEIFPYQSGRRGLPCWNTQSSDVYEFILFIFITIFFSFGKLLCEIKTCWSRIQIGFVSFIWPLWLNPVSVSVSEHQRCFDNLRYEDVAARCFDLGFTLWSSCVMFSFRVLFNLKQTNSSSFLSLFLFCFIVNIFFFK